MPNIDLIKEKIYTLPLGFSSQSEPVPPDVEPLFYAILIGLLAAIEYFLNTNSYPYSIEGTADYPPKCGTSMDKLIVLMILYTTKPSKSRLKKILKQEKKVLKLYLINAANPCSFTRFFQAILISIQDTIIQNSPDSVHIVSCMINKMMQELLKIQESVCCKSPHGCKGDKECVKDKEDKEDKKHDKTQNHKCDKCR
jgi:hypothetical protein